MNQPLQHEHGPHGAAGHDASPSTPLRTPRGSLGPRLPRRIAAVVLSSALGLGLVHHPVPSRAQTAEARGAAQNKARMGRALADSGKHEAALQYFKDAYEIHQDPGYLYNLGIEYQALGRDVDALAAFDLFLRDAQKIPPEFVADAHQQLRELHKRLGTVEIRCTQEGARILVDDQQRGKTPGDRLVSVVPGTHRVSVLKDGFEPFTTTLAVAPGAKVSVEALLRVVPVATSPIASGFGAAGPRGAGGQAAGSGAGAPPAAPMTSGTFGGAWGTNGEGMPAPDAAASGEQPSSSPWGLPSRTHLTASSGVGVWLGGVPESPGPSAVFSVGAGYAITRLSARTDFRLGGRLGLTFLSEPTSTDVFVWNPTQSDGDDGRRSWAIARLRTARPRRPRALRRSGGLCLTPVDGSERVRRPVHVRATTGHRSGLRHAPVGVGVLCPGDRVESPPEHLLPGCVHHTTRIDRRSLGAPVTLRSPPWWPRLLQRFGDRAELWQLFRYLLVGGWNTLFGYATFALLTMLLTDRVPYAYMVANVIANVIAITVAFLGYKWFVFKTRGNYLREYLRTFTVYGFSMLLGLVLLPILVVVTGHFVHDQKLVPYIAQAAAIPLIVVLSFVGHKKYSFRTEGPAVKS